MARKIGTLCKTRQMTSYTKSGWKSLSQANYPVEKMFRFSQHDKKISGLNLSPSESLAEDSEELNMTKNNGMIFFTSSEMLKLHHKSRRYDKFQTFIIFRVFG